MEIALIIVCILAVAASFFCYNKGLKSGEENGKKLKEEEYERTTGSAKQKADSIIQEAQKESETLRKSTLLEAKDEIHKLRTDAEAKIEDRKLKIERQE